MNNTFFFVCIFIILSRYGCREKGVEPPTPRIPTITLCTDSIGIMEVWLRVHFNDTTAPRGFTLKRDGQLLITAHHSLIDIIVEDTTLLRGRTYLYKAYRLEDSIVVDSSDALIIKTIDSASIKITYAEPLVAEIDLEIMINDCNPIRDYRVDRNGQTVLTGRLAGRDTVITDEGLTQATNYTYTVYRIDGTTVVDSSAIVAITTLTPTSQNWTFVVDTLGDGNSSVLYDVAIINDTLAYAVGEINVKDSLGNWITPPYNIAKWNGKKWELKRTLYKGGFWVIKTIFAFHENNIWFSGYVRYLNGQFIELTIPDILMGWSINKLWGSSSNNLYAVGNDGNIAYYNGTTWQKMESGTDVDLLDVWGSPYGSTVWACGYYYDRLGTYLLRYQGSSWEIAYDGTNAIGLIRQDSLSGPFTNVYTNCKSRVYIGSGVGIYQCPSSTRGEGKRLSPFSGWFPGFPYSLHGIGSNDLFIVGAGWMILHYNGITWRQYSEIGASGKLRSISVNNNLMVAVGENWSQDNAVIIIGSNRVKCQEKF